MDDEKTGLSVENKLLILYLIDKMDLPLSRSQITEFANECDYMDYYTLQQTLAEMVEDKYLEKTQENNNTRFSISDEGLTALEYFEKHIPGATRARINKYVHDNFNSVKKDYEITANYFLDNETNEYIVKCGVYDDEKILMEINISVVSRDQAKLILNNWKTRVNVMYMNILRQLISTESPQNANEPAEAAVPANEAAPVTGA